MRAVIYLVCKKCGNKYPDDLKECDMCLAMPKLTKPEKARLDYSKPDIVHNHSLAMFGFNAACDLYEPYHEQEIKAYVDECNRKIQKLVRVHEQEVKQAHAIGYSEARLDMAVMVAKLKAERSQ